MQAADGGSKITFQVTGTRPGYTKLVKVSSATSMVPWSKLKSATPKVKGVAKVGATLRASTGKWTSGTAFAFQWYRSGKAIAGATASSYRLTAADVGRTLKVKVVGSKQGYKPVAKTSKATKKVS